MRKVSATLLGAVALLGAAGCGSQNASMSGTDQAQFRGGGPGQTRSPEQQKAMNDFITEFNKKHPSAAAPQGAPQPPPNGK